MIKMLHRLIVLIYVCNFLGYHYGQLAIKDTQKLWQSFFVICCYFCQTICFTVILGDFTKAIQFMFIITVNCVCQSLTAWPVVGHSCVRLSVVAQKLFVSNQLKLDLHQLSKFNFFLVYSFSFYYDGIQCDTQPTFGQWHNSCDSVRSLLPVNYAD